MKKLLTGLLCVASTLQAQVEYEYPIDHGGVANDAVSFGVPSLTVFTFTVTEDQTVSLIQLRFAASHSFVSDMGVTLKSPNGVEVKIFDGIGGGARTYFNDVFFTDAAADDIGRLEQGNDLGTNVGPWSDYFSCQVQIAVAYSLSSFQGVNAKGTWELIVTDYEVGDTAYIYAQDDDSDTIPNDRTRFGSSLGTALFVQFASAPTLSDIGQWRVGHFETPANSGHGKNGNDFDKDGLINFLEFALGRDPKSGVSGNGRSALPEYRRDVIADKLIISMNLPDPLPEGVLYRIQASDDLSGWSEVARKLGTGSWVVKEGVLSPPVSHGAGRQLVELAVDASGHTQRWLRLQVVEEP